MEAFNRRDVDAAVVPGYPDFELHPPPEFVEAGFFEPRYRGSEGFRKYVSAWSEVLGPRRSPRSRGAVGVGHVTGERGVVLPSRGRRPAA
jgi:hypothetical protein